MMISILAGAAAFGFLGSLHCALMCGPLAVAGCGAGREFRWSSSVLYFGGRLTSYAFAGAAFGALGAHLGCAIHLEEVQRALLAIVASLALFRGLRLFVGKAGTKPLVQLKRPSVAQQAARWVAARIPKRGLTLGIVTGALPCGLLAGAWALAAASAHPVRGTLVMAVFFVATSPALVAAVWAGGFARFARFASSPRWQGALWCALAFWMVARSLLPHGAHHGGH
jgi:sulfite exporter TauE/SafE